MGETHREKDIFPTSEETHPNIWICYPQQYIRMKKFNSSIEGKKQKTSAQLCPTLWNPLDCSLPGSSVHGIFFRQEYCSGLLQTLKDLLIQKAFEMTLNLNFQKGI